MDSNVLIVLIVVVGIVAIVYMFRDRITKFIAQVSLKDRSGNIDIEAAKPQKPQANPPDTHSVVISRNKNIGKDNSIEAGRGDVAITDNVQIGQSQKIVVKPDSGRKKK